MISLRAKERSETLIDIDELSSISSVKSNNDLWESIEMKKTHAEIGFNDNKWMEQTPNAQGNTQTNSKLKAKNGLFSAAAYEELEEMKAMVER